MEENRQEILVKHVYERLKNVDFVSDNECVDEFFTVNSGLCTEFSMDIGGQYVEFFFSDETVLIWYYESDYIEKTICLIEDLLR
jgi:hypothetical protein